MKFRTSTRLSSLVLIIFFVASFAVAQERDKESAREGHAPRTKTVQPPTEGDRDVGEDGDRENPVGREQWFMRGRMSQGRPATKLLIRAQQQREQLRLQTFRARQLQAADRALKANAASTTTSGWMELGPAPLQSVSATGNGDYGLVTGRVTAVAVDQGDPSGNTVYVGGAYGGVWKSTTAANLDPTKVVWKPITDDQATLAIGAIAVSPADSNIVLVGTGESNSSSDSYYGLGILRSTDAGNSWSLITSANNGLRLFHGLAFAKIAFKSDNPTIVVAATAAASEGITVGAENPTNDTNDCKSLSVTATCRGLYYSYDSGQTWNQVTMVDNTSTNAVPDNGSASDVLYNPQEQRWYAFSRAHGMYTSSDGITFTRAADQGTASGVIVQPASNINLTNCPSTVNLQTCPSYRAQITQVPGRDEMYVWFVDASSIPVDGGIYKTTDGGKTWTTINVSAIENCGDGQGCGTEQGDYNLVLTAVPNGQGTDLYAGAINIYRCQIDPTNNPSCTAKPFINLTHVYGCSPTGSFSHVHPDQHSFDFSVANPNVIYFGNDGGVYRTIASENGASVPSACQSTTPSQPYYPFDNLNGKMGSMTQFVWFQQHPTNQFTMLGGTQDNGSPAIDSTNSGTNGITWRSVLGGDGGWTDINPSNPNEWFTENTKLSPGIQRCANGTNCTDSTFVTVINSAKVAGDASAFYMPYMLDPQNPAQILLGTCRVWRVPSNGVNVPTSALSPKFDGSLGTAACASTSTSFVNALAAGGPKTSNGSQAIYAGTADGHIWVTTAADSASSWNDRSVQGGFQEPLCTTCPYPVSGLAIDPRDATGNTAYATAMGFRIGHIWMTTNAGVTWADISGTIGSGGLPDAPADGVVIDPATGTIYVATDVGVYSTSAVAGFSTQWTEVGPATGPGTLPNVAITRIAIFNPSGQPPLLRVSTYGRGIWQMSLPGSTTPDYSIAMSSSDLESFPNQSVTYNGTETALNGYNGTVTLSCNAGGGTLPSTCSASAIASGAFTVTASNAAVQDFSFRVQGTDGTLVRFAPVTLRVVDFGVGVPTPAQVSVNRGSSQTVQVNVSALGSFDQSVTIDCDPATLPTGMTCTANPIVPSSGSPTQVTVTINTTSATQPNIYTLTIRATSTIDASHSMTHTQTVQVTVTTQAGFGFDTSSYSTKTLKVGQPLSASVNLVPHDYSGSQTETVTLTCSAPGAQQCSVMPGSVSLDMNNTTQPLSISLATTGGAAGAQQLTLTAAGSSGSNAQASLPFSLTDFSIAATSQPANAMPGGGVSFNFQLVPLNGYNAQVTLVCDTGALGVPCTFTPPNPTLTSGATTAVKASFTIPGSATAGSYTATVTASDATFTSLAHPLTTSSFMVQVNPDFSFSFGSASVSAKAGATIAPIPITVSAAGGFNSSISWGVAGCPSEATCAVSPNPSTPSQTANLTITTKAPSVSGERTSPGKLAFWIGLPFGSFGLVLLRRKKSIALVTLLMLLGIAACGGGSGGTSQPPPVTDPGTPAGTYNIVVTGTSGNNVHPQTFVLTVQ